MHFIDEAKIHLKAGDGGNGIASFRREKYVEYGGPDGGSGGSGASIVFRSTRNLNTLIDFRYKQHFKGEGGKRGGGSNKTGRSADDLIIEVPVGTQILSEDKKYILYDLDYDNQVANIIDGGRGGLGNSNFKSSRNQAPRKFTEGIKGIEMSIWLNLKLLSNIGLLGLPNAGKSTLLSILTSAKPKIANYPFTTLKPQLGVVYFDHKELVIADLPGLIENASLGQGLGIKFLKHMERCQTLLHIVDISSPDIIQDYNTIRKEVGNFGKLVDKPEMVILSKSDAVNDEQANKQKQIMENYIKKEVLMYSGINMKNIDIIKRKLFQVI
ncbi:MAG: GTP-binding protein [Candidatus Midichloriaceae bacterium]|jgi:GTP-binding protein